MKKITKKNAASGILFFTLFFGLKFDEFAFFLSVYNVVSAALAEVQISLYIFYVSDAMSVCFVSFEDAFVNSVDPNLLVVDLAISLKYRGCNGCFFLCGRFGSRVC